MTLYCKYTRILTVWEFSSALWRRRPLSPAHARCAPWKAFSKVFFCPFYPAPVLAHAHLCARESILKRTISSDSFVVNLQGHWLFRICTRCHPGRYESKDTYIHVYRVNIHVCTYMVNIQGYPGRYESKDTYIHVYRVNIRVCTYMVNIQGHLLFRFVFCTSCHAARRETVHLQEVVKVYGVSRIRGSC